MNALTNLNSKDLTAAAAASPLQAVGSGPDGTAFAIGLNGDERRMQMRVYNHWARLLGMQKFPSIEDLDPAALADFGPYGILLDLTGGIEQPGIAYVGDALAEEAGIDRAITQLRQVPPRCILSQITEHYLQIYANRAPTGFDATFKNRAETAIDYRGILLPFTSNGETIDFIYGVITWKEAALAEKQVIPPPPAPRPSPPLPKPAPQSEPMLRRDLATCLAAAQAGAARLRATEERTRGALYQALGRAHDFAMLALERPADLAILLHNAGLTAQERAPMVPLVKLIFGAEYDKSRISEFAAALGHARRIGLAAGALAGFLGRTEGGLKAVVAAERRIRRGESAKPAVTNGLAKRLGEFQTGDLANLPGSGEEFALVLIRRTSPGTVGVIGEIPRDATLLSRATKKLRQPAGISAAINAGR